MPDPPAHAWKIRSARSSGCGPRRARRRGAGCGCRPSSRRAAKSWLTPAPPCAWIASSMICSAMRGALTLIIAISAAAALLPALSIMSAALRHKQPRAVDFDPRLGDALLPHAMLGQALAERHPALQPPRHRAERFLGRADGPHAMVDAPRSQPALRDLEPAPFAEQQIVGRHAHVLERDFHVAVRRVVIAIDGQAPLDRDARRRPSAPGSSTAGGAWPRRCRSCPSGSRPCSAGRPRPTTTICGR